MVLATTLVGFYLGSHGGPDYVLLLHTLAGTFLAASGTMALNEFLERDTDSLMARTRMRPLPSGRVAPSEALIFGAAEAAGGIVYLALNATLLSSLVTALITATYLFLYTPLKKKTCLCSIVGAFPGALPPVIGWAAATGEISTGAWVLFSILFLWQIPHTLAIAKVYHEDYAQAGIRLLPVLDPEGYSTERQVASYCLALLTAGLLPTLVGMAGWLYFLAALILGMGFLAYGLAMAFSPGLGSARRLLFASLIYLPVLLIVMAVDKVGV
jgi:protoheme IX farnesyltransferase